MIYLDNAATTRTAPEVVDAMLPYFTESYGNPSSVYNFSSTSKAAISKAREQIASLLGCSGKEIYFTASGSEADNWALVAAFEAYKEKGNHIITSKIEHHAILHTCEYLERDRGARVTYLDVDSNGTVDLKQLEESITDETILISIMYANNEVGTIQPVAEIGRMAREHGVLFHTDGVQSFGQISVDVNDFDMFSSSAHKINGPKGIGFLYIRDGLKLRSFIHGGGQERSRRAGTENVPAIVGYGVAATIAYNAMESRSLHEKALRDYMIGRLLGEIEGAVLNGHPSNRLPNNVNVSFHGVEGESLLIMMDMAGICASSGSACASGSLDPSHVLLGMGVDKAIAKGSLRLTLGCETTREDIDTAVDTIKRIVERLRKENR